MKRSRRTVVRRRKMPANAPEGYRMVLHREKLEKGDIYYSRFDGKWVKTSFYGSAADTGLIRANIYLRKA